MSFTKEPRLTTQSCTDIFKTMLRTNNTENRHRDLVRIPYDKPSSKKTFQTNKTDIFNDQYKKIEQNLTSLRENYLKDCVRSKIKNNLTMQPEPCDKKRELKEERFCSRKLKTEIINDNHGLKNLKRVPTYEKFYNDSKEVRNPIRSMSVEELDEQTRNQRLRDKSRSTRYTGYMKSNGLASTFNYKFNIESEYAKSDKITKNNYNSLAAYANNIPVALNCNNKSSSVTQILNYFQTEPQVRRNSSVIF